ncbi:hypothetical protein AVEN_66753-1 [Araneus ventricosus]|uniref:ATP-dependent DNA helicase n=1 Tax=Araneus ventricosus TaxID=182803 RepID=A0A4Y2HS70_ARAVE|nr:hypothetical protein AVEN_66753-1 [Araneus ventricosus]
MPTYLRIFLLSFLVLGRLRAFLTFGLNINNPSLKILCIGIRKKLAFLYALAELLKSYGLNLRKVDFPSVDLQCDLFRLSYDAMEEQSKASENIEKLNSEQRYAVYNVLHAIYEYQTDLPKCCFLGGPAETGKTFVYSTLLHAIRGKGDQDIAVASTGIAATFFKWRQNCSLYS